MLATDPAAPKDFQAFAREAGLLLETLDAPAGEFRLALRRT